MKYVCIRCEELINDDDAIRDEDGDYFHEYCYKEYVLQEEEDESINYEPIEIKRRWFRKKGDV